MDIKSRQYELDHLAEVLEFAKKEKLRVEATKKELDERIDYAVKHYDPENLELYNQLMVDMDMQSGAEELLKRYSRASSSPYFGRVDFQPDGEEEKQIYIGRGGLYDERAQRVIVADWRTPVGNLYYDSEPGRASYTAADGEIKGEMSLKRTYDIKDGVLNAFYDTDLVSNDQLLQEYLAKNADAVLKEIVATIQKDQNEIIRIEPWNDVIVQGVAGSGKTTVAMHRLSFLFYNYPHRIKTDQFMIIGANRMFLNYISGMLPDLGVEKVRQMVMGEWLRYLLRAHGGEKAQPDRGAHKAGAEHFRRLEKYMDDFVERHFLSAPLTLWGVPVVTEKEIRENFIGTERKPLEERAAMLLELGLRRASEENERRLRIFEEECDDLVYRLKKEGAPRERIAAAIDEKYENIGLLKKQFSALKSTFRKMAKPLDETKIYLDFLKNAGLNKDMKAVKAGDPDLYDSAALLYIASRLYRPERVEELRHIIVDEAQDFGPFIYHVLSHVFKNATFTLLGDVSQNLSGDAGISDWEELTEDSFAKRKTCFRVLSKSYRNTIEIAGAANAVLSHREGRKYDISPVVRHGDPVELEVFESEEAENEAALREILAFEGRKGSLAVVCPNAERARKIHALAAGKAALLLRDSADEIYEGGITVFDAAGVKGLEFDRVLVLGADDEGYPAAQESVRLLYVAMTRALHELKLSCRGKPAAILTAK